MATSIAHVQNANGTTGTTTATSYTLPITGVSEFRTAAGGMYLVAFVAVGNSNTAATTCTATYGGFAMTSLGQITSGQGLTAGFLKVFGLDLGVWPSSTIPLNANLITTVSAASTIQVSVTVFRNTYGGFTGIGTVASSSNTTTYSNNYTTGTNFVICDAVVSKQALTGAVPAVYSNQPPNTTTNAGSLAARRIQGTGVAIAVSYTWGTATPYGLWVGSIGGTSNDLNRTDTATFNESASLFAWEDTGDMDEVLTFNDSASLQTFQYPICSDSATSSDSSALGLLASETETFSESTRIGIASSDSATASDSSTRYVPLSVSDSATVTESATGNFSRTTTDTFSATDTATSSVTQASSDSATATDQLLGPINTNQQTSSTDSSTFADTSSLMASPQVTDIATTSETKALTNNGTATEQSTLTDSSALALSRSDLASLSENSQIAQSRSDSATLSEPNRTIQLNCFDVLSLIDTQTHGPWTTDLSTTTEQVTGSYNQPQAFEELIANDELGDFIRYLYDDAILNDDASEFNRPYLTEEPLQYGDKYYFNREFRIIAQDHFTRKFIHWDLPLSNVQIVYSLTGPNPLSGEISTEIESLMNLDPPLMPDRTWLHVEQDGLIRGSFILTPFVDEPSTQTRKIEAEGFSAYPHWITYQGAAYTGIQVDPADMIRKLWDHVQSFPDGNLNVKVTSTKTAVKIGEPPQSVNFQTSAGNQVSFQAGPYTLNYWSVTNCGDEIGKLCKETPIEYYEYSRWNKDKTDIELYIILGYPRVGTRRGDIRFREGVNLAQLIPSYQGSNENYASDVIVIGAGNGPTAIRASTSGRIGLLRKTNIIQNQDITNQQRAQAIADFEFNRISHSRFLIQNITVDTTHPDSLWGSFAVGDDIFIEASVLYIGMVQDWYRIVSYTYDPYTKLAVLTLLPSESFTYGAENVDPYSQLPTAGFAKLSNTQDYSKLFDSKTETNDLAQLQGYVIQAYQQGGCDYFNKNGLKNGLCLYWRWIKQTPDATHILPQASLNLNYITALTDTDNKLILAKDDSGHIITEDNIQLIAENGTVGQPSNQTSSVSYANPYYVPDKTTNGNSYGTGSTPSTGNAAQDAGVKMAQTRGMEMKNQLNNGRGYYYRLLDKNQVALIEAPYPNTDNALNLIVAKTANGTLTYGTGFTTNATGGTGTNTPLQQAAQAILSRMQSGQQLYEDWTWQGAPAVVGQYNDQLLDLYDGYRNMSAVQFLSAVANGQIK